MKLTKAQIDLGPHKHFKNRYINISNKMDMLGVEQDKLEFIFCGLNEGVENVTTSNVSLAQLALLGVILPDEVVQIEKFLKVFNKPCLPD